MIIQWASFITNGTFTITVVSVNNDKWSMFYQMPFKSFAPDT